MKLDRYELRAGESFTTFEFLSEGRNGKVIKVVQFQLMNHVNLFNLAFGDKQESGKIDDMSITDNGDSEKVLATVVAAIYVFCSQYPNAWVYATGSTASRTRLYRIGINKYYDIVQKDFYIMGESKNEWEWYKKDEDYEAFAVQRKIS